MAFSLFNLIYIVVAILGLSFLIFIHELGHYWMARRVGMRVETFSIGFGRPLYTWVRDGVKWQIGWLLFGGYVKIAGQELEKGVDPYSVTDGFFGKSPLDRIKVAFAGPFVNIVFALVAFGLLWAVGGREKSFSEFTHKIGWIDPKSELYTLGVRPGDEITSYDGHPFQEAKDHLYAPMLGGDEVEVRGNKVDYFTGEKKPFTFSVKPCPNPAFVEKGVKTVGVLRPTNYEIYNRLSSGADNPLPEGSPMLSSGIRYGDRIVWADGDMIFSQMQLSHTLNDGRALLTIQRDGQTFLKREPRVEVQELKLDPQFKEELTDWQYEAQLNSVKFPKLYTIPYNLTNDAVVEGDVKYIDKDKQAEAFPVNPLSPQEEPLKKGDKIIAIDGFPITRSYELLARLQSHYVNVIVARNSSEIAKVKSTEADEDFDRELEMKDLQTIVKSVGTDHVVHDAGDFHLLNPIVPKMRNEFILSPEKQALATTELLAKKKEIESIEDPNKRSYAMQLLESQEKELMLGLPIQDRRVVYNPGPVQQFEVVYQEIVRMLGALVSGHMNPKFLSGPIGIVQVMRENSRVSWKESLFWLGAISLNLGILNLLPIPVLDGGTIAITLFELITRRRMNPKTLEKIIIPFAILLIAFFVFLTYHDISRIFNGLWK